MVGARHVISTKENDITMQLYDGLIASLLIVLWTGGQSEQTDLGNDPVLLDGLIALESSHQILDPVTVVL